MCGVGMNLPGARYVLARCAEVEKLICQAGLGLKTYFPGVQMQEKPTCQGCGKKLTCQLCGKKLTCQLCGKKLTCQVC